MSFRYPAGLITADSPVNANYPSGVWTPLQTYPYIANNVWGQDPFFEQTTLLLHGDGTNGAQNNTFLDSSTNNFTITRNGNTTQGTFSPFSLAAGQWSNYFDGTGDYLTVGNNAAFDFGSGDFTLEAWVNIGSSSGSKSIFSKTFDYGPFILTVDGTTVKYYLSSTGSSWNIASGVSGGTVSVGSWAHVALVRNGNTVTPYVNGVAGTTTTTSATLVSNTRVVGIGAAQTSSSTFVDNFNGYISNARIVKGTAVYTSAFTPPTAPLTNISNTSLLTCQSNRFVDNSTNAFAITRNGDVKVTAFSPFQPTQAYSPAVTGGSGYFDGSGDYLSASSNITQAGDFTIECWLYTPSRPTIPAIFTIGNEASGRIIFYINGSNQLAYGIFGVGDVNLGGSVPLQSWVHIAFVRSSTTVTAYINGVATGTTGTLSGTVGQSSAFYIGSSASGVNPLTGYISNLRVVNSAVYTTGFTPPTSPVTAISGTQLLCNFTNAGILDNTNKNNLETVGNAQIDTSIVKYGTGSMEFDGSGDYLLMNGGENFAFGTGDFTIEFWYYSNNTGSQQILYDGRPATSNGSYVTFYKSSSNVLELYVNTSVRATGTTSIAASTWYHVALCRSGTSTKMFLNGTQEGSTYTDSTNYLNGANRPVIGADSSTLGNLPLNGYIDDLRITKGIARYTANFTPPIARMPNQ